MKSSGEDRFGRSPLFYSARVTWEVRPPRGPRAGPGPLPLFYSTADRQEKSFNLDPVQSSPLLICARRLKPLTRHASTFMAAPTPVESSRARRETRCRGTLLQRIARPAPWTETDSPDPCGLRTCLSTASTTAAQHLTGHKMGTLSAHCFKKKWPKHARTGHF